MPTIVHRDQDGTFRIDCLLDVTQPCRPLHVALESILFQHSFDVFWSEELAATDANRI